MAGFESRSGRKWHLGCARQDLLPTARGFDSFYGFLGGCEDHMTQANCCDKCDEHLFPGVLQPIDLHRDGKPAYGENGTKRYSHNSLRFGHAAVATTPGASAASLLACPVSLGLWHGGDCAGALPEDDSVRVPHKKIADFLAF